MNSLLGKQVSALRRAHRVRTRVQGTPERPRLNVHISHRHVMAQIIDDSRGVTVAYATTVGTKQTGNLTDKARWIGSEIAAKAKKAKVSRVALDRGSKRYHGRVKVLAEAARESGLEL